MKNFEDMGILEMAKTLGEMGEELKPKRKITEEDITKAWIYPVAYLAEILNGEYSPEEARKDILSLLTDGESE